MGSIDLIDALEEDNNKDVGLADEEFVQNLEPEKKGQYIIQLLKKRIERMDEEIKDLQQDRLQRKTLSYWLFGFMGFYMLTVIVTTYLCGFKVMYLSDTILGFLLTTTLADVIGIFSFVAKYLYHNKS